MSSILNLQNGYVVLDFMIHGSRIIKNRLSAYVMRYSMKITTECDIKTTPFGASKIAFNSFLSGFLGFLSQQTYCSSTLNIIKY